MSMEDRLRAAMRAEANSVEPDEYGSLDAIRARGRAARNRRRAVLGAGLAVVVAAAALATATLVGDDDERIGVVDEPTTTTDGPTTTAATAETTTSTAVPPASNPQVVWPEGDGFSDPVDAVRSFVTGYLGFPDPPLSEFRQGDPSSGEVDVFATGEGGQPLDRVAGTVLVRRFGDAWFVTGAASDEVVIESPGPLDVVADPVVVDGRGRGFEGNIVLDIREAFATEPLVQEATIGGCCEELQPFHAEIPLFGITPATPSGALVAITGTGLENAITGFTVIPIRFEAAQARTVQVFFHRDGQLVAVDRRASSTGVLRESLTALLVGPTADERAAGLESLFDGHAGFFEGVTINDGAATVSLGAGIADDLEASSSAQATAIVEQLNATVFQFPTVELVQYELGGSCEDFGDWVQPYGTCEFERP